MEKIIYFKKQNDTTVCLLVVLYITSILANLTTGYRYIALGSFMQSGGIFIFPFSFIISDIITERHGSVFAKKLVYYGIFSQFLFSFYAWTVVHLPAPAFLSNQNIYFQVFNPYLKFAFASSISVWLGSILNIFILSKLSERIGGKYFALRSFVASTAGEFIVTLVSMLIANFTRMDLQTLFYMIFCCFFLKTIISFFAIWPAAIIVYLLENGSGIKMTKADLKNPIKFLARLAKIAWYAKGYSYNLELINIETKKISLFFKGTRGIVQLPLKSVIQKADIIDNCSSSDAAKIGYYYGICYKNSIENYSVLESKFLRKGRYNIIGIQRDGSLIYEDIKHKLTSIASAVKLYNEEEYIKKFSPSQSMYIGYLASQDNHKIKQDKIVPFRHLTLVQ